MLQSSGHLATERPLLQVMKKTFGNPQRINQSLIDKIKNTKINLEYIKKKNHSKTLFLMK